MSTQACIHKLTWWWLVCWGCLIGLTGSVVAQDDGVGRRFGIVDSFVNPAEATAAGAQWTRIVLRWDVIQPGGPTDWKPANVPDPQLEAELAAGREIVAVLIGTPAWATESGRSTAVPPLEAWGDFVFKVATQYQGRINRWVIWNRPEVTDAASPNYTWAGSVEDYYQLLKVAHQKIKAVDPTMSVHLAGLEAESSPETSYLAQLLGTISADPDAAAAGYFFDVVSYHLYYDPTQLLTIIPQAQQTLERYGLGTKPIWINELNAPPTDDYLAELEFTPVFQVSLQEQSAFVVQAVALGLAAGADRLAVYKLRNESFEALPYGLLRADNSRRPAFTAFQTVATHFAGVQQADWQQIEETVYVVTLDRREQTTTVLWNTARTPITLKLTAIASQGFLINERGTIETITPQQGGYTLTLPPATCSNGDDCFIGGAPRLIVEAGSASRRSGVVAQLSDNQTTIPPTITPIATATPILTTSTTLPPTNIPPVLPPPTLTPSPTRPPNSSPAASPTTTSLATPDFIPLPDPGVGESDVTPQPVVTSTPIPPVSISTVLTPDRILWLFLIGIVIFTLSYGTQVVIWYRLRK